MKRLFVLLPLLWIVLPLPVLPQHETAQLRLAAVLLSQLGVTLYFAAARSSFERISSTRLSFIQVLYFSAPFCLIALLSLANSETFLFFALAAFVLHAGFWGLLLSIEDKFSCPALISLALACSTFFSLEWVLQTIPGRFLRPDVASTPNLYSGRLERAENIYRQHGFHGQYPAPAPGTVRIFSMGGSSTFGIPIVNAHAPYPTQLGKLLRERRPRERYEVYNAGLAGMGIMQILDSLKSTIVSHRPAIVTISAWYNDSSKESIWYGTPGKSDRDAYLSMKMLKWIQDLPLFRVLYKTRSFAYFRLVLLSVRDELLPDRSAETPAAKVRRMSPEEFSWALRQIALLGREKNFLPVFVYEVLNRSGEPGAEIGNNQYYQAIRSVAAEFGVPIVDTLAAFHHHQAEWLFFDSVHPNVHGHRLMAESIFQALFDHETAAAATKDFLAARGMQWMIPNVSRQFVWQGPTARLAGQPIQFQARAPFLENETGSLVVSLNEQKISVLPGLKSGPVRFQLSPLNVAGAPPLSRISIEAAAERLDESDKERYMIEIQGWKVGP